MVDSDEVTQFIESRKGEVDESTLAFVSKIVELEKQKKEIMADIKSVKDDAKSEGVDTTKTMKAFRKFCKTLTTDPADQIIEDGILALIEEDVGLIGSIYELVKKD